MSLSPSDLRALLDEGKALQSSGLPASSTESLATESRTGAAREGSKKLVGEFSRPAASLQPTWIDPEETDFTPVQRPGSGLSARLFSLFVSAAIIGALAWLIVPEVNFRIGTLNTISISNGVLAAQAVPLAPVRPAVVTEVYVDPSKQLDSVLPAGTPIARLEGTTADGQEAESTVIVAPFDARLASVDTLVGAVTQPGTPVATVYDPQRCMSLRRSTRRPWRCFGEA
ncbi:MAG: hypothetical protein R2706_01595 [Acidimicrobiales bacterium]